MAKTLRDFWNKADGVYDFVDKNGVSIDDMNYPLETEVLNERLIEGEQYEITLNVDIEDPYSIAINRYKKEYPDRLMEEKFLDNLYYEYKDGVDLLASKIDFDIIFMDFQMKDKNGIDTVSALRQRNNNTHVIFASSYKDVVFDSLKVKTFRFLIKPIEKEKLYEALNSLIREKSNRFTVLVRNTEQSANYRILERNIIFAQAENVSTLIYASDKCYKYADTLSAFQKELSSDFFFRSHRSFLVNMKYITNYSKNEIIFSTGEKALLSKIKYKEFQKTYFDFMKRESIGLL